MKKFLLIVFFFCPVIIFSQNDNFERVDTFVKTLKVDNSVSIENLVIELTKPFTSEIDKVRAIYYWLSDNIEYDYQGMRNKYWKNYPSIDKLIKDTYKFRKGVCSCYSHLFHYMLNLSNIESNVISGYVRTDLETFFANELDHAWNSVKIENEWYLFDVTWSRDTTNKKVDNFWFMTDPEIFILSHFPEDTSWRLTKKTYTLSEFRKFPVYTNLYYTSDFTKQSDRNGYYRIINDTVKVNLKLEESFVFLPKIYDLEKSEWFSPYDVIDRTKDLGYFKLLIDRKGKFILRIAAIKNGETGFSIYDDLIYYTIETE